MSRRTITFLTPLAATAMLAVGAVGATGAGAKQGADDPAGHVRHSGTDDNARSTTRKCKKATSRRKMSSSKRARACRVKRSTRHVADDRGGLRPAGVSDDPATHNAGDDRGGQRAPGVSDDPAGDDHGRGRDDH